MSSKENVVPIRQRKNLTVEDIEKKYKHTKKADQLSVVEDNTVEPAFTTMTVASSDDYIDESKLTPEELLAVRDAEIAELKDKLLAAYEAIINLGIGELIL